MYSQVLDQIDDDHAYLGFKALQWLAFSTRPLYIEELSELSVITEEHARSIHPDQRFSDPRHILELLPSSLVTTTDAAGGEIDSIDFTEQRQQVHLAGPVKEYLLSEQIRAESAKRYSISETKTHASIAADCLAYLLHFNQPYTMIKEVVRSSALLRYATNYWASHARLAGADISEILPLIKEFFTSKTAYTNWTAFLDGFRPFDDPEHTEGDPLTQSPDPLYYAASFGLLAVARDLLRDGAPVDSEGPAGTALAAASLAGDIDMVRLLIDQGANVRSEGPLGQPIRLAAQNGHLQVVEYLSMRGAK
ncbi:hypothetical protein P170DRAFT_479747 [Aspergillus steynii IBT 23096]|uniref:Uncharacterized protein n=1 Tax=Aspergillus steynii IBT 23096 TaxID=1392250 RepID=A0A2I2FX60_9EURO|nr:uncharacterized protein P170DRAFT_479747 [Aspergillus steynii IBT 23096]PLB45228.1 hypothetical protein P170DRAFT_479747 [Aspergillus steynii IBT 23096]